MKTIKSNDIKITKDTSNLLKLYYQEIRNLEVIDKKTELKLFEEYKITNSQSIKQRLINNNLRFVLNVSKYYHNGDFYELIDVISSGNIGLIKAVEEFDPSKGYKFSTYAVWWIKQSILDGIAKESKMIKQPNKSHSINQKYLKIRNDFYNRNGFEPNIDDIKDEIGEETASEILAKSLNAIDDNNIISMYKQTSEGNKYTYDEVLPSTIMDDAYIYSKIDTNSLNLKILNKIEKIIVSYKYGFEDKPELSFNQIGELLNLKEKEIIKIHDKALLKIKNDL